MSISSFDLNLRRCIYLYAGSVPKISKGLITVRLNSRRPKTDLSMLLYDHANEIRHLKPLILKSDWLFLEQYFPILSPVRNSLTIQSINQFLFHVTFIRNKLLLTDCLVKALSPPQKSYDWFLLLGASRGKVREPLGHLIAG